ncbi:hypothetical protein Tco_1297104, partial [Tanacetum coccineum]
LIFDWFVCIEYGERFLGSGWRGRGVNEKQGTAVAGSSKDIISVGGFTASDSVGQGTKGSSDIQTGIPTVDNTRPLSYINVVPMEPSSVPGSVNDVTKEPDLIEKTKSLISFAKLVTSELSIWSHVLDERPKNIVSDVEKNLKNPRQAARGVLGPKVVFKPVKQVYRLVSSSDKKKEAAVASKEYCTAPIAERIDKIERKVIDAKLTLVDDDGKPLHKVVSTVNVDSDSEVEDVVNDHAVFMTSTGLKRGADSGYGTNSLLEQ